MLSTHRSGGWQSSLALISLHHHTVAVGTVSAEDDDSFPLPHRRLAWAGPQNLLAFSSRSCKLIFSDLSPVQGRAIRQRSLGVTTRSAGLFLFPSMPNEGQQGQFKTDYCFAPPAVAGSVYPFPCTSAGRHSCRCARPRTRVCFARLFFSTPSALRSQRGGERVA